MLAEFARTVAALDALHASSPGSGAAIAALEFALGTATIAAFRIAIIALVRPVYATVAAGEEANTGFTGRTHVGGVLLFTIGTTAIVVVGVAIVAHFTGVTLPVSAHEQKLASSPCVSAGVMRFDLAGAIASVSRTTVAVIALLAFLTNAVAAGRARIEKLILAGAPVQLTIVDW